MLKESIICIIIVIVIIFGNNMSQNYTVESVEDLTSKLNDMKEQISVNKEEIDNENIKNIMKELNKDWEETHNKLAYFIEHDELEKVETDLTSLNSFIETNEYSEAIAELDKAIFVLKHIEDKYAFDLENIF